MCKLVQSRCTTCGEMPHQRPGFLLRRGFAGTIQTHILLKIFIVCEKSIFEMGTSRRWSLLEFCCRCCNFLCGECCAWVCLWPTQNNLKGRRNSNVRLPAIHISSRCELSTLGDNLVNGKVIFTRVREASIFVGCEKFGSHTTCGSGWDVKTTSLCTNQTSPEYITHFIRFRTSTPNRNQLALISQNWMETVFPLLRPWELCWQATKWASSTVPTHCDSAKSPAHFYHRSKKWFLSILMWWRYGPGTCYVSSPRGAVLWIAGPMWGSRWRLQNLWPSCRFRGIFGRWCVGENDCRTPILDHQFKSNPLICNPNHFHHNLAEFQWGMSRRWA